MNFLIYLPSVFSASLVIKKKQIKLHKNFNQKWNYKYTLNKNCSFLFFSNKIPKHLKYNINNLNFT